MQQISIWSYTYYLASFVFSSSLTYFLFVDMNLLATSASVTYKLKNELLTCEVFF